MHHLLPPRRRAPVGAGFLHGRKVEGRSARAGVARAGARLWRTHGGGRQRAHPPVVHRWAALSHLGAPRNARGAARVGGARLSDGEVSRAAWTAGWTVQRRQQWGGRGGSPPCKRSEPQQSRGQQARIRSAGAPGPVAAPGAHGHRLDRNCEASGPVLHAQSSPRLISLVLQLRSCQRQCSPLVTRSEAG